MGQHLLNAKITANIVYFRWEIPSRTLTNERHFQTETGEKHSIGNKYEEKVAGHF